MGSQDKRNNPEEYELQQVLKLHDQESNSEIIQIPPPIKKEDEGITEDQMRYKIYNFLFEEELTLQNAPSKVLNLLRASIPNIFTQLSTTFFLFVNMYFIQKTKSPLIVGAYGLATTWFHSACYSALLSLNNGLFTQVAQAYGAQNFKLIGQLFNKALAIALTFSCIALIMILNTANIMIFFGIKEETAEIAQEFVVWLIPSLFLVAVSDCLRNALLGIQKMDLVMNSYMLSYLMHPIWLLIFFDHFGMVIIGMSLARCISDLNILLNLLYNIHKEKKTCKILNEIYQPFLEMETLRGWLKYLKVAIPVGSIVYLEWAFYEVTTIIVGMLQDDNQLAGHTSFQSMTLFFYMMPLGLSMSVNSFLGSCVGDGKKKIAINFYKISIYACLLEIVVFMIVGVLLHPVFRSFLVTSEEIGYYYDICYNIYIFGYIIPDYIQCIFGAILRSAGLEQRAMMIYIIGFYVIGFPTSLFMVFTLDLEVSGIWYGLIIASGASSLIFYYEIQRMDWDKCIEFVKERVDQEKLEQENLKQVSNRISSILGNHDLQVAKIRPSML
ncbi:hypothetical protein ABPG74_012285 [Tetrahymena malaccensis]